MCIKSSAEPYPVESWGSDPGLTRTKEAFGSQTAGEGPWSHRREVADPQHLERRRSEACLGHSKNRYSSNLRRLLLIDRIRYFVIASTFLEVHRGTDGRYCALYTVYRVVPF